MKRRCERAAGVNQSVMSHQMKPLKPKSLATQASRGTEGIFYLVPFPNQWCVMPEPFAQQTDFGHTDLWEQTVVKVLVKDWHLEVCKAFPTRDQLRAELLPLVYAFPRGRVVRQGSKFIVYHGDNFASFMGKTRQDVESCFHIQRRAKWVFDEHEQCVVQDRDRIRAVLRLKETWPAVSPAWD
jgi:hypothetical protein